MNRIRREVLNGLFVIVLSTLLSVAIAAFQVKFDVQLWVWIVMAIATAITGYVIFEFAIGFMNSTEEREKAWEESTRRREEEWLKRVGTPARLEMNVEGEGEAQALVAVSDAVKHAEDGSDYTVLYYIAPEGSWENVFLFSNEGYSKVFAAALEGVKLGRLREYKRIFCFDHDVLAKNHELRTGVLRVGEGPGTITKQMGEHCRLMMQTKGCSLYVAPVVLRNIVAFFGTDKVSMTVETTSAETGGRSAAGVIFFCDPPNGEIVEQFRQLERETERRMVSVHTIRFPEGELPKTQATGD
jgi:hypothetical protein